MESGDGVVRVETKPDEIPCKRRELLLPIDLDAANRRVAALLWLGHHVACVIAAGRGERNRRDEVRDVLLEVAGLEHADASEESFDHQVEVGRLRGVQRRVPEQHGLRERIRLRVVADVVIDRARQRTRDGRTNVRLSVETIPRIQARKHVGVVAARGRRSGRRPDAVVRVDDEAIRREARLLDAHAGNETQVAFVERHHRVARTHVLMSRGTGWDRGSGVRGSVDGARGRIARDERCRAADLIDVGVRGSTTGRNDSRCSCMDPSPNRV